MKNFKKLGNWLSLISVQLTTVLLSLFIILSIFNIKVQQVDIADPSPNIIPLTPKELAKTQAAAQVRTGVFIKRFQTFDIVKNDFVMNAILWFEFDPRRISLDSVDNFAFENATIIKKSTAYTKLIGNNIFVYYEITIQFSSELNFPRFPFDDHRLHIMLTNPKALPSELLFTSNQTNFQIPENFYTRDWKYRTHSVTVGYSEISLDKAQTNKSISSPAIVFGIDFVKAGIRKIIVIFVPLILVFFLTLASLALSFGNMISIVSLSVGGLSSMFGYRFVVESMTPNVGYFTISDKVYAINLVYLFIIFLINILSAYRFYEKGGKDHESKMEWLVITRCMSFYLFCVLEIVSLYYCLFK